MSQLTDKDMEGMVFYSKCIMYCDGVDGNAAQYHQIFCIEDMIEERELTPEEEANAIPTDVYIVWERTHREDSGTKSVIRAQHRTSAGIPQRTHDYETSGEALKAWRADYLKSEASKERGDG